MITDQFRLEGRNILITGASSGIGRSCAVECSRKGANVILVGRDVHRLKLTLEAMDKGNHSMLALDVTRFDTLQADLYSELEKYGVIHGFVHAAGIQMTVGLNQMNLDKYHSLFDVNVYSALEITKILSNRKLIPVSGSSVVFISSVMGIRGRTGVVGYSATKGALISAMRALAVELAKKKVRVNCVSPGLIMTELVKGLFDQLSPEQVAERSGQYLFWPGEPDDVANACVYLLSDAARWVTGINLVVDGGCSAQ